MSIENIIEWIKKGEDRKWWKSNKSASNTLLHLIIIDKNK